MLATILYLFAIAPLAAASIIGDFQQEFAEIIIFLFMFGTPGTWFAYLGIRNFLEAGRVQRDQEDSGVQNHETSQSSKLFRIGRNLILASTISWVLIIVPVLISSSTQYDSTSESSEEALDTITTIALYVGFSMALIASVGLFLLAMGTVFRLVDIYKVKNLTPFPRNDHDSG